MTQVSDLEKAILDGPGCFSIGTYVPPSFDPSEQDPKKFGEAIKTLREFTIVAEVEACDRLIKPLMASATHARLYPSKTFKNEFAHYAAEFLLPRRGYLEFNLNKDCVSGNEEFWRAGARKGEYRRGTIVVVQPSSIQLGYLLRRCVLHGVMASRYQILKGSSSAAVHYAEEHPRITERLFLFSASNGIEHAEIYPPREGVLNDCIATLESTNRSRF